MRLSLAAASLAISVALLAGCSSSSQGTLPGGASQTGASGAASHKTLTREQVAKLHPNVLRPGTRVHHADMQKIRFDKSAKPAMVITDDEGYIWWLSKKGAVTSYTTDCSGAEGGVIDKKGRLVVACTNSGTVNVYNKGNTTGPANVVLNGLSGYYPAAAFEDAKGNIYATNLYGFVCTGYYCYEYPGNVMWWATSNQGSGSSPSGSYTDPNLFENFFADVDALGNVYVDGLSEYDSSEVDEISNITQPSASATNLGISLNFPGGIYAMGNGDLSVNDQGCYGCGNNALYIYSLPYNGSLVYQDKSPQNFSNTCDPVAAGYEKGDKSVLIGDATCRAGFLGNAANNTWKSLLNINFGEPIDGAFLKSDK